MRNDTDIENPGENRIQAEVHRALLEGQVDVALELLNSILSRDPCNAAARARAAQIFLRIGQYLDGQHNLSEAYRAYLRALVYQPDMGEAQTRLLEILPACLNSDGHRGGLPDSESLNAGGQLVIGIGTGRCGSTSLARLLSMQEDSYVGHEHPPILPWECDQSRFEFHCRRLKTMLSVKAFSGDVAHWWLPYLPRLLVQFPNIRVICMQRERQATIRSFNNIKGKGKGSANHWISHDGEYWTRTPWDECYPKYDVRTRDLALGLYWDEYYAAAINLAHEYPSNIAIFDISLLGTISGQERILEFCGYSDPVTSVPLTLNKGTIADGIFVA